MARANGLVTVGFSGAGGGKIAAIADLLFSVESSDTARVQECHILAGHVICDWVEQEWVSNATSALPTTRDNKK